MWIDTDFILSVGPEAYAWNVVRSEADDLIFRHAGKCGAKIFDGVKVSAIEWAPVEGDDLFKGGDEVANLDPGRPISASWVRKDGSSGQIKFDYLVDASGRAGVVSTKYLKNRTFNQDLKNVANWAYWKGAIQYGMGTPKEGWPFFEALHGLFIALMCCRVILTSLVIRREWLGLVYPASQWHRVRRSRHEPSHVQGQEENSSSR